MAGGAPDILQAAAVLQGGRDERGPHGTGGVAARQTDLSGVALHDPVVRLRADLSDPNFSAALLPPHFTNIQHGLRLARQVLGVQDTPNRQIILITDDLPTAHFEEQQLYMLYPPHDRTARATLREGLLCRAQGMVINFFLLGTWAQSEEDVKFAHALAESTSGRVFFVAGGDLERFVVWDYLKRRRLILG